MVAGINLVPPPPLPPDGPVIKEIIHYKSCTLFPQNPSKMPSGVHLTFDPHANVEGLYAKTS